MWHYQNENLFEFGVSMINDLTIVNLAREHGTAIIYAVGLRDESSGHTVQSIEVGTA